MEGNSQPHAVMFPYPAQGHINPMLQLAKRLMADGFFITFVNTENNHERMIRDETWLKVPNLRFEHIPDGLPAAHGRFNESVVETMAAIEALSGPFGELVKKIIKCGWGPALTCIIADAFSTWVQDVADRFSLPRVSLWTTPIHANLAYHFQSTLISQGHIPLKDKGAASNVITCIPGVAPMRLENYISFFLAENSSDFVFQWLLRLGMKRPVEAVWNLGNNFGELETDALGVFRKEVPNFLPIGPLLPESVLQGEGFLGGGGGALSLWPEDACEEWLAQQEKASVLYISFGSIANMVETEVADLIRGLEESGAPFLWAVRPDQNIEALSQLRRKLATAAVAGTASSRALLVSWAPQLAVLSHPSVGAFLTHCGWNSVVEGISSGVPILAKPGGFAEQCMNAHYVADVWQVGLRMPPSASAFTVKSQICSILGNSPAVFALRARMAALREFALSTLSPPSGSSYSNYRLFVDDMQRRSACC